ncbi:hypothetical protein Poli38472_004798 [Pythium oligandrum]|uniref:SET domain-containing protein n=1 Tax=Pythium oligandrum TaxID=41045 RepID=A0A8K1FG80_PYTOL|nr:hypothetical protein Poli38472_004798 [Pythium oligandrum]|eukprot:TMW59729.1 hypothetical protein Poli38472_004798 [Pythium oligandrum]
MATTTNAKNSRHHVEVSRREIEFPRWCASSHADEMRGLLSASSSERSPPAKILKPMSLSQVSRRHRKPHTADRHSCLAAPYAPTDPRTARYFELVISKSDAPVVCGFAGKLKGKAIYADRDLRKNEEIWTEAPYLGMQHELSKRLVPSCQYCFVPLIADYQKQWKEMVAAWNEFHQHAPKDDGAHAIPPHEVREEDLEAVLQRLHVDRRQCGFMGPVVQCVCGDQYCSRLCQTRAYHEFHAILCPREDAFSSMNEFLRHTQQTNDIFFIAAKVIARVLSRYLITQDLVKAREPMDMFYKKPWWEVVMIEKQVQQHSSPQHRSDQLPSPLRGRRRVRGRQDADEEMDQTDTSSSGSSVNLKDLLVSTHQLLLDALDSNLVALDREDQLHGHSVDEIWTNCASILSFEFFAAQLGLFEMNNIHVEIDHPFQALTEILDPESGNAIDENATSMSADDRILFERVHAVLSFAAAKRVAQEMAARDRDRDAMQVTESNGSDDLNRRNSTSSSGSSSSDASLELLHGFPSIDGTALFPIICTMNHSCDPNCTVLYTRNGDAHVVAVRDIKQGEELCICYIDVDQDVRDREDLLREYRFRCLCPRCSFERRQLRGTGGDVAMDDEDQITL